MRIDRRITNRNIMLAGGVTELVGGARMEGMNRRPIKVFTDTDRSRPSSAVRGIDQDSTCSKEGKVLWVDSHLEGSAVPVSKRRRTFECPR